MIDAATIRKDFPLLERRFEEIVLQVQRDSLRLPHPT